jgi:DNA-binding IclR family transcriptional regulator
MAVAGSRGKRDVLGKALRLLRWMLAAPGDEWGVRELAYAVGLAPSTAHRLLIVLEREGLMESNLATERYRIGLEFYHMAWRAQAKFSIREMALPFLRRLATDCGETTFLALYDRSRMEMMFAAVVDTQHPYRYILPINQWVPIHAGASGQAIMAFLSYEDRQAVVATKGLPPVTSLTFTDPAALEAALVQTRARGYAISHGQRIPDSVSIAAPIWGPDGRVLGDIAVTMPEHRFRPGVEEHLGPLVIFHAGRITEELGGQLPAVSVG